MNQGLGFLQKGDNHKNAKVGWPHLKIFFSRTKKPDKLIFTQKLSYLVQIQVSTNHGPRGSDGATMGKTIFTYVYIGEPLKIFS
jgi:hypothetical protein